jgi:arylsulfatase A-like enzyme
MNRGFDTSRGFMFPGTGDQFDWKSSLGDLSNVCGNVGYDLVYDDVQPSGGASNANYRVDSRDAGNTWPGKTYIHNGQDNYPDMSVFLDSFSLYKQRANGNSAADQSLNTFEEKAESTNYVVKTVREETVRHIESKDGSTPFFMNVAAPAMRTEGMASDQERQDVFDIEENDIDACNYMDDTLQPFPAGTSVQAIKTLVEDNGQSWSSALTQFQSYLCTDDMKRYRFNSHAYGKTVDTLLNSTIEALYRKNLWENTLIVLTFDNGGQPYSTHFNWPLRGTFLLTRTHILHANV